MTLSMIEAKRLAMRSLAHQPPGITGNADRILDTIARELYEKERVRSIAKGVDTPTLDELVRLPPKSRRVGWKTQAMRDANGRFVWFPARRKRVVYSHDLTRLHKLAELFGGRIMYAELGQVWPTPDSCPDDPRHTQLGYSSEGKHYNRLSKDEFGYRGVDTLLTELIDEV